MVKLTINREQKSFDAPADMPLLWVLRDVLGMSQSADECEARKIPAQCCTMTGLVF
jgi:aerobic-type carbon monoxide dehydrogenase small subunit (CoxS/CutS family)